MDLEAFVAWAHNADPAGPTSGGEPERLAFLALGLLADAGEVADLIKKRLGGSPLDRDHLAHELGDVLYYWARLCAATGVTPSELLARSRQTIEARIAKRQAQRA